MKSPLIPKVSYEEDQLLRDTSNGLLLSMYKAWNQRAGIGMKYPGNLWLSTKRITANLNLTAIQIERFEREVREIKIEENDGFAVRVLAKSQFGSSGNYSELSRFIKVWRCLARLLRPEVDDRPLNESDVKAVVDILVGEDEKDQVVEFSYKDFSAFMRSEVPDLKWSVKGQLPFYFDQLLKNLVRGRDLENARKDMEEVKFAGSDYVNARSPGAARDAVRDAFVVLARQISPDLARKTRNDDSWLSIFMKEYARRKLKPEVAKPAVAVYSDKDPRNIEHGKVEVPVRPLAPKQRQSNSNHLADAKIEIAGGVELNFDLEDFAYFMTNFSHLGIFTSDRSMKRIPYFDIGSRTVFEIHFTPRDSSGLLRVFRSEKIGEDASKTVWASMARRLDLQPLVWDFNAQKPLRLGRQTVYQLSISAPILAKMMIKHRLNEEVLLKILSELNQAQPHLAGDYMAHINMGEKKYVVIMARAGGYSANLKTIYEDSGVVIRP